MIDTNEKLAAWLPHLAAAEWIALDTEADSLHAYPEKICLLQITSPGSDALIDPLAGLDLAPLLDELRGRELILHGADYDLRLLRRAYNFVPHSICDTMLAARLLGCEEFGLANLVSKFLGVTLEKGPQKANWALRPLTERMAEYARNDTRFLHPLAQLLRHQLREKNRLGWLQESGARLVADCAQLRPRDADLIWRIKGSDRLDRASLAVLRELWHWREGEAVAANKPPFFILSHEIMVAIASAGTNSQPLESLLPRHISPRRRAGLAAAVERGRALPSSAQPEFLQHTSTRITDADKRQAERLKIQRDQRALELGIDPTLIASRATLVLLAQDWPRHQAELMSWQRELMQPLP